MRFLACAGAPSFACVYVLLLGVLCAIPAQGQTCHDMIWDTAEFCGRDAYVVTGQTEMNHDCFVDALDFALFAQNYLLSGPNLSGDFNGDQIVDLTDFAAFAASFCNSVSPCLASGILPDECMGSIALSFSPDSTTIVSTTTQTSGRVYVVVEGWTNAQTIEFGIETSSNVLITRPLVTPYPYWTFSGGFGSCDPDPQHSQRLYTITSGTWPSGPIRFAHLDYVATDTNPAWLKLTPMTDTSCPACKRLRWAQGASNRSFDFATVLNAGINGPAPPGENTCSTESAVPTTNSWALLVLGCLVLMLAFWMIAWRRRAQG